MQSRAVPLCAHPSSPGGPARAIDVWVERSPEGSCRFTYRVEGDLARIRLPEESTSEPLWQHTCFELFVSVDGSEPYHELNIAPSGRWQAYFFERYRVGGPIDVSALEAAIDRSEDAQQLTVVATVELAKLDGRYTTAPLRLGLSAVIEAGDGEHSWWALRHPGPKPDFHHRDSFALSLEPPHTGC